MNSKLLVVIALAVSASSTSAAMAQTNIVNDNRIYINDNSTTNNDYRQTREANTHNIQEYQQNSYADLVTALGIALSNSYQSPAYPPVQYYAPRPVYGFRFHFGRPRY